MGAFGRSWHITKLSFRVMGKDKELILYPILSFIFSIIYLVIVGLLIATVVLSAQGDTLPEEYAEQIRMVFDQYGIYIVIAFLFIINVGLVFIITFFRSCVVYTAKRRFAGENATPGSTIGFAFTIFHLIFMWAIVAATVGLILRMIELAGRTIKGPGRILLIITSSLLGLAWYIVTLFVVPAIVYKRLGPFKAIGNSTKALKKTWGEQLIRHVGTGLAGFLLFVIGTIIAIIPIAIMWFALGEMNFAILSVIVVLWVLYIVFLIIFMGIANTIFNTALYEYAEYGKTPGDYSQDDLTGAFRSRKRSKQPSIGAT